MGDCQESLAIVILLGVILFIAVLFWVLYLYWKLYSTRESLVGKYITFQKENVNAQAQMLSLFLLVKVRSEAYNRAIRNFKKLSHFNIKVDGEDAPKLDVRLWRDFTAQYNLPESFPIHEGIEEIKNNFNPKVYKTIRKLIS